MNISDKYKLIFFHYPKCAGKSVVDALGIKTSDKTNIESGMRQTIGYGVDYYNWNSQIYPEKWNTYKKFTIVRNPWDRAVSLYNFRKKENDLYNLFPPQFGTNMLGGDKIGPDGKHWDFKRWLLSSLSKGIPLPNDCELEINSENPNITNNELFNYDSQNIEDAMKSHRLCVTENYYNNIQLSENKVSATGPDGKIHQMDFRNIMRERIEWFNQIDVMSNITVGNDNRFNGKILVDYILKFEHLNRDWDKMFKELGHEPPKLPHKNKYEHKHYSEYYDDETREFVGHLFEKDIKEFGYEY